MNKLQCHRIYSVENKICTATGILHLVHTLLNYLKMNIHHGYVGDLVENDIFKILMENYQI